MTGVRVSEGEHVTLRRVEESDVESIQEGVSHPERRGLVGQPFPTSLRQERRYFEEADADHDRVGNLIWADGECVGVVEFDPVDRESGVAELVVWVHPDHLQQRYARVAVSLFVEYAFAELRVHRVTASAYDRNEGSRRLLESVGFVEEGVGREDSFLDGEYRDTHYFGLLGREWREN